MSDKEPVAEIDIHNLYREILIRISNINVIDIEEIARIVYGLGYRLPAPSLVGVDGEQLARLLQDQDLLQNDILVGKVYRILSFEKCIDIAQAILAKFGSPQKADTAIGIAGEDLEPGTMIKRGNDDKFYMVKPPNPPSPDLEKVLEGVEIGVACPIHGFKAIQMSDGDGHPASWHDFCDLCNDKEPPPLISGKEYLATHWPKPDVRLDDVKDILSHGINKAIDKCLELKSDARFVEVGKIEWPSKILHISHLKPANEETKKRYEAEKNKWNQAIDACKSAVKNLSSRQERK